MSQKFYFTYGTDNKMPFIGGWTEVTAPNRDMAIAIFRAAHPDRTPNIVNCSFIYSEDDFVKTSMYKRGNYGKRCVETLALQRKVLSQTDLPFTHYILFNIMRVRACENEHWFTQIYLGLSSDPENGGVLTADDATALLKEHIHAFLASRKGWEEICSASKDFNWGDLAMLLPVENHGLLETPPEGAVCSAIFDITVNQDELLAPDSVPATLTLENNDGAIILKTECNVDLQEGVILLNDDTWPEDEPATSGYVTLKNGDIIPCDPANECMPLKTLPE